MPKVEFDLEIEQIAKMLEGVSPGELETLEILLNPELRDELKKRRGEARIEFEQGKTLSKDELFSAL
ncbi:MAG: hypothetical protein AAGB97_08215 [Dehalococcoidia bacterium]|nr:hypothetical protein [Chloroflexota bacterium]